jgi:hypothetical protein
LLSPRRVVHPRLAVAVMLAALFWLIWGSAHVTAPVPGAGPRPLGRIPPGTRIGDRAPPGWTHLVVKSRSELASGDLNKLHPRAAPLARLFFTAMVARVAPRPGTSRGPFRLEEVAVGLGTRIGADDVIITSQTQKELGADLGLVERMILSGVEEESGIVVQVGRSDTMAIIDVPVIMLAGQEHRDTVVRHVLVVDPEEGRLATVVWRIDVDATGAYRLAPGSARRLPPDLVEVYALHVDGSEVTAGIPSRRAYAGTRMPRGTPLSLPPALRRIAAENRPSPEVARQIEVEVRRVIGFPQPP